MGQFESFIGVNFWTALFILLIRAQFLLWHGNSFSHLVHNMIESRQKEIDQLYADAEKAKTDARELRSEYEAKISGVRQEADRVIKTATRAQTLCLRISSRMRVRRLNRSKTERITKLKLNAVERLRA